MRLYHYTSIDSLALILHNQTIRFKRLDQLDDLNEIGIYKSEITKRYFVSCWTNTEEESIAQWSLYGHNKRGVIIGLDTSQIQYPKEKPIIDRKTKHVAMSDVSEGMPFPIEYLELPELEARAQQIEQINDVGGVSIYGQLGNIKSKHWAFQQEYRLSLLVHKWPVPTDVKPEDIFKVTTPIISHFDLKLEDSFREDITVTLGPLCTESDKILVESLMETFGLTNPLKGSALKSVLRNN